MGDLPRHQQKQARLQERQRLGWAIAQEASHLLKSAFGATQVMLFGSMRHLDKIHDRSDVDLAVWGINPRHYFRAVSQLQGLHPNIAVDLVEAKSAPPRLLQTIEETGAVLLNADAATLAIRIRAELAEISQVVDRAQRLLTSTRLTSTQHD